MHLFCRGSGANDAAAGYLGQDFVEILEHERHSAILTRFCGGLYLHHAFSHILLTTQCIPHLADSTLERLRLTLQSPELSMVHTVHLVKELRPSRLHCVAESTTLLIDGILGG